MLRTMVILVIMIAAASACTPAALWAQSNTKVSFGAASYTTLEGESSIVLVELDQDIGAELTITLTPTQQGGITADDYAGLPATLTFALEDAEQNLYAYQATFTFEATEDEDDDDGESLLLQITGLPAGFETGDHGSTVLRIQDEIPEASFASTSYQAAEGSGVQVALDLTSKPGVEVTVPLVVTPQGGIGDGDYSGIPAELVFGTNDTRKTFTFTAAQDTLDDDGESVLVELGDLPEEITTGTNTSTTLSVTDDDDLGVVVDPTALTIDEGSTGTYRVSLSALPQGDVTVTVTEPASSDITVDPGTLTFTTSNWSSPQTVTVTAGQDDDNDDDTGTITHSAASPGDSDYDGITVAGVDVTTEDDDQTLTVTMAPNFQEVEEGSAATVKVVLDNPAREELTLNLAVVHRRGASSADHGPIPSSVTLLAGESEKEVTYQVLADAVADPDERIRVGPTGLPDGVERGRPRWAVVNITEPPTIPVSFGSSSYTVAEGGSVTVTVNLESAPGAAVNIPITVDRQGGAGSQDTRESLQR